MYVVDLYLLAAGVDKGLHRSRTIRIGIVILEGGK